MANGWMITPSGTVTLIRDPGEQGLWRAGPGDMAVEDPLSHSLQLAVLASEGRRLKVTITVEFDED
jgi:hypothetical protein